MLGVVSCQGAPKEEPATGPDAAQIRQWIQELGNADFKTRAAAKGKLSAADETAIPLLKEAAGSKDPEVAAAAKEVLGRIGSIGAQLRRMGAKGLRKDLAGERWFLAREDGEIRGAVYFRLDPDEATGSYRFQAAGFIGEGEKNGEWSADEQGEFRKDFSLKRLTVQEFLGQGPQSFEDLEAKENHFNLYSLVWFFPFWELSAHEQEVMVPVGLPGGGSSSMKVKAEPEREVPAPRGAGKASGISFLCEEELFAQIWWDKDHRLVRILLLEVFGKHEYFPATREEAVAAVDGGKRGEWWKARGKK